MGTAHILIEEYLLNELKTRDDIRILRQSPYDDTIVLCMIESSLIPDGYQGQMSIIINADKTIRFVKDVDV
jgi:hypothetical protein